MSVDNSFRQKKGKNRKVNGVSQTFTSLLFTFRDSVRRWWKKSVNVINLDPDKRTLASLYVG